jgi:bis(5'-nucleosyl)-tetraphosphatase (symmetrical)
LRLYPGAVRWLVGDIQGCARELERLLSEVRFDPSRDELWALGDLINRGPDSLGALQLWRDVGGKAVLGNHDVYALLARSGRVKRKRDTLDALFASPSLDALLDRLRAQPLLAYLPADPPAQPVWVVHAGLHPRWRDLHSLAAQLNGAPRSDDFLQSDEVGFATRVRCCTSEGERSSHSGPPSECQPPYYPWDRFYLGQVRVVHGHWALRGHYRAGRAMGLDSGCVYGGQLTAWCQEEDRIVQIPAARRY